LFATILGICLEESQPSERTLRGQVQPLERTFGRVHAPPKPTFALIRNDFPAWQQEMQKTADSQSRWDFAMLNEIDQITKTTEMR
jgi:hypothetical protein